MKLDDLLLELNTQPKNTWLSQSMNTAAVSESLPSKTCSKKLWGEIQDESDDALNGASQGCETMDCIGSRRKRTPRASSISLSPDGDYETLAGYILYRLGRIPKLGETVSHDGFAHCIGSLRPSRGRGSHRPSLTPFPWSWYISCTAFISLETGIDQAIGIDLGTTNSCAAIMDGGQPRVITACGGAVHPQRVHQDEQGHEIVGQELWTKPERPDRNRHGFQTTDWADFFTARPSIVLAESIYIRTR